MSGGSDGVMIAVLALAPAEVPSNSLLSSAYPAIKEFWFQVEREFREAEDLAKQTARMFDLNRSRSCGWSGRGA
jgi:hypothetical protein